MIPKLIHYCWFGGNSMSKSDMKCIESWGKFCPDYEIKRWDESNYDVKKNIFMYQAYQKKKWAFVSDYARLDIVYQNGGIYLDTDVEIIKSFDLLLENKAVMGFEDGEHVSTGLIIGAEKNHSTIKEIMSIYDTRKFVRDDGSLDMTPSPIMNTKFLQSKGCKPNNKKQSVSGITIYPTEYFCPKDYQTGILNVTEKTYSVHWFHASWQTPHQKRMHMFRNAIGHKNYDQLVKLKNRILRK